MNLTCDIGKPITWDASLARAGNPLALPVGTKLWLTVKLNPDDLDSAAIFQLTDGPTEDQLDAGATGIAIVDRNGGRIRLRASAAMTALLSDLVVYSAELQVLCPGEDPDVPDDGRGTLTGTRAITAANA